MYPFLSDKKQHQYKPSSSFNDIINLYCFDRELRILIFSTIEKIEVAIRAQIANHFSVNEKDAFWYTDAKDFLSPADHQTFLNNTLSYIKRSTDAFILHFFDTYSDTFPPIWVVLEVLSMGQLSILYNITKRSPSRKAIASYFGIKEPVLANWLHTLVYVRNICAHHARLWNKDLRIQIKNPKTINRLWLSSGDITKRKIYEVLAIITCFVDTISPNNTFRQKLETLIQKYPCIDTSAMGFPKNWKDDPFWSVKTY
jgi:abortive infection bacteriophage resistance protein